MNNFKHCILFSPAGRFTDKDLAPAFPQLQQLFKNVTYNPIENDGYFSGNSKDRVNQFLISLKAVLEKPGPSWLMAVRGGYGTIDIAETFSKSKLSRDFVLSGFSDISILLNLHQTNKHFYPVYGINAIASIAQNISPVSRKYIKNLINDFDRYNYDNDILKEMTILNSGSAKGEIFGGCLSVLVSTLATPYFPDLKDKILFLEDVSEPVYKIDRMLKQFELAGVLEHLTGVILGEFYKCEAQNNTGLTDVFRKYFLNKNYPVVYGFPMGHSRSQVPLKFKWPVELAAVDGVIKITYQKPG